MKRYDGVVLRQRWERPDCHRDFTRTESVQRGRARAQRDAESVLKARKFLSRIRDGKNWRHDSGHDVAVSLSELFADEGGAIDRVCYRRRTPSARLEGKASAKQGQSTGKCRRDPVQESRGRPKEADTYIGEKRDTKRHTGRR